ncbi:MFS transporter [bacterium]|nr:MFS transporter [bacterium]
MYLLKRFQLSFKNIFLISIIPGLISFACIFFVKELSSKTGEKKKTRKLPIPRESKLFLLVLGIFMLGNSSDGFLLLRARIAGLPDYLIPLLWAFFHFFKIILAPTAGRLSDKYKRKYVIVVGWVIYALSYFLFSFALNSTVIWFVFAFYGLYHALTEGVEKAFISEMAPAAMKGQLLGLYNGLSAIMKLAASLIFGVIWKLFGYGWAFGTGAAIAIVSTGLFIILVKEKSRSLEKNY